MPSLLAVIALFFAPPLDPGIERLHAKDVAATLSGDPDALAELWTEDAVRLQAGADPEVGRATIHAHDARWQAEHPSVRISSYHPRLRDARVVGDWAFEWGVFEAQMRSSERDPPVPFTGSVLRVLRRLPDRSWRFACVMVAPIETPPPEADDERTIAGLEGEWLVARDRETLDRILADDFVHPVPSGDFVTKTEHIAWVVARPRPAGRAPLFSGLRVRIYGDIAIATGSVVNGGDRTVFTDVFARRDGRWQAINAQENAVQAR